MCFDFNCRIAFSSFCGQWNKTPFKNYWQYLYYDNNFSLESFWFMNSVSSCIRFICLIKYVEWHTFAGVHINCHQKIIATNRAYLHKSIQTNSEYMWAKVLYALLFANLQTIENCTVICHWIPHKCTPAIAWLLASKQ